MDHRATSLRFIRALGLHPVKVRPGQKDPFSDWEPRAIAAQDDTKVLGEIEADPELNLGALFCGKFVDIDIDSKEPLLFAALDYFLPATPYVWGRASKRRSHRAYVLPDDFSRSSVAHILRYAKAARVADQSYSVEIRGGAAESGFFAVLPGSYRKDVGETVEWEAEVDLSMSPPIVSAFQIVRAVRLAIATAMIASFWTEGMRNDLSLALSGLLWRVRASSLVGLGVDNEVEVPDDQFFPTEEVCSSLFQAVLHIADPNKADRRARELNFTNTWRKLEADPTAKCTGGRAMAELIGGDVGKKLVHSLYFLLSDNQDLVKLEELYDQFKMWYRSGVLIDMKLVSLGHPTPWMNKEQATNSLGGQRITVGDKKVPVSALLFNSAAVQRVAGLTFDPSTDDLIVQTDMGAMVNQWRGFAIEPSSQAVTDEEVLFMIEYFRETLAAGDLGLADYMLDHVADIFQNPGQKIGTAMVLVGLQGAGKTFLGEGIIAPIIGPAHALQLGSIATLTNKFNALSDNKIFIQCNEAVHYYQKDVASKLKAIITDTVMVVEPKGIDSYRKPNHARLNFTSNDTSNPVFIDPDPNERRFTVAHVSPKRAPDIEYWDRLRAMTAINVPKIHRWFKDRRYDRKRLMRPYNTSAKRDIQRLGVEPEVSWVLSKLGGNFPLSEKFHHHWWHAFHTEYVAETHKTADTLLRDKWPNRVVMPQMEADFMDFVRAHGRPVYAGSVATILKRVFPEGSVESAGQMSVQHIDSRTGQVIKSRIRLHHLPSRQAIMDHLIGQYGPIISQLMGDDMDETIEAAPTASLSTEY